MLAVTLRKHYKLKLLLSLVLILYILSRYIVTTREK